MDDASPRTKELVYCSHADQTGWKRRVEALTVIATVFKSQQLPNCPHDAGSTPKFCELPPGIEPGTARTEVERIYFF